MSKHKNDKKAIAIAIVFLLILATIATFVIMMVLDRAKKVDVAPEITVVEQESESEPEPEPEIFAEINLQNLAESWRGALRGEVMVSIYDFDNEKVVASLNADQITQAHSLYKLPTVYVGMMKVSQGEWDYGKHQECLDLAIRESSISCGEALRNELGGAFINKTLNDLGVKNVDVVGLTTSANGMVDLLKVIYSHREITDELVNNLFDSMLNQPPSAGYGGDIYDWRQGLPKGFSEDAKVYNKVGWLGGRTWQYYNDAAIVELKDGNGKMRHLAVVVLTKNTEPSKIVEFGKSIEEAIKLVGVN